MKVKLVKSKTKWGKKMEKSVSGKQLKVYTKLFLEGLFGKKVKVR